jgi:hypothetical protein
MTSYHRAFLAAAYILVSPAKREWAPKGMFPDVWRVKPIPKPNR